MEVKVKFNDINVKEEKEKTLVKILMLKGEKGDTVSAEWGTITGSINNQTDLKNALDSKANNSDIPTETSDLNNDSGFITNGVNNLTNYYKKNEIDDKLENKVYYFDNVDDMKSYTFQEGNLAITKGYYSANDGGAGEYEIVSGNLTDDGGLIHELSNGLYAKLIIKGQVNIKQLGAYGNDTNDDTNVLQYAIDNFNEIYIPKGIYKITDEINVKSNLHLYGDGASSVIKSYFEYNESIKYSLLSDSTTVSINRTIIENLKFTNNELNTLSGGIYIEYSTRGLVFNNLWFEGISNNIKLGKKIWGLASLKNIYALFLPSNLSAELQDLAYGILCEGNTIYGDNIEIIGVYKYGLYLNTCNVGSWNNLNIGGSSSSYQMKNAILVENSKDIYISTGWFEQLEDGNDKLTKSINLLNSEQISLDTMHIASGSLFVDNSKNIKIYNSNYYSSNTGLRYMNNSEISCDLVSLGYCNYQSNEEYMMGTISIVDFANKSNSNIFNNPLFLAGIYEPISVSNSSNVTKTTNTTDMLTGDRCFNFHTVNYQGALLNTSNIVEVDKIYTLFAYVKCVGTNVDKIYINGTGVTNITTHPNEMYKNTDNNTDYHLLRYTFKPNNATNSIKIIAKTKDGTTCDFIVDSIFIVEGEHDNSIPSPLDKKSILINSKLKASTNPYSGTWNKGDIVYNNFSNSNNDNIMYWEYNGTSWIAINFPS